MLMSAVMVAIGPVANEHSTALSAVAYKVSISSSSA